jgi:hypothetical protein
VESGFLAITEPPPDHDYWFMTAIVSSALGALTTVGRVPAKEFDNV